MTTRRRRPTTSLKTPSTTAKISHKSLAKVSHLVPLDIDLELPDITKKKKRSISHENQDVKEQREARQQSPRKRIPPTNANARKSFALETRESMVTGVTGVKTTVTRKRSISDRFEMIQQKVRSMGALREGGSRRRASIRLINQPLTIEQRRSVLDKIGSLDVLSDTAKDEFAEALSPRVFGKGENIMREGEIGREFFIIESGKVEVSRSDSRNIGQDKVLAKLGVHDYFGKSRGTQS